MPGNEKRIRQNNTRRTKEQRLQDALANKPVRKGVLPPKKPNKFAVSKIVSKAVRTPPSPPENGAAILLTGGLGDVMALESYMTDSQRESLKVIYYATRQQRAIQAMFEAMPRYKAIHHVIVWDDFRQLFAFFTKNEVTSKLVMAKKPLPHRWNYVADYSIAAVFPKIKGGTVPYRNSSLLDEVAGDTTGLGLPDKYVTICPHTINDKRMSSRDFDQFDWDVVLKWLRDNKLRGVVINQGDDRIPGDHRLIDLSNKTTVGQAINVVKGGVGYFGIDSAFSVLAAKLFDPPRLVVKTKNPFLREYQDVYYQPKKSFGFVRDKMEIDG